MALSAHTHIRIIKAIGLLTVVASLALPTLGSVEPLLAQTGCTSTATCLAQMTLAEKIGQMTQVEKNAFAPTGTNPVSDIATYGIGSILSGGGGGPNGAGGDANAWANMVDNYQQTALSTRLHIPMLYGADGVHGHNNVTGATIFPHHIAMGAMHDTALITQAEQVTRDELLGTGVRWTFAPCLCVPQDDRWGRTYEGYSEVASDVQADGAAAIIGFQGTNGALGISNVLATAKHYVADGHTTFGTGSSNYLIDQGDARISESVLDAVDLPPFQTAITNKVGSVMISYSSWNGAKDHGNAYLINTVLKGTGTPTTNPTTNLGFQGFVVSDWAGINPISTNYTTAVTTAINAGIDMVMVPDDYKTFINAVTTQVNNGSIPMSRINDAVTRILNAKFALGLFTSAGQVANRTLTSQVGSAAHRAVARQAVRESQVLLKNNNATLPLSKTASYRLVVGGSHANDLGLQMGGWSISWQGAAGATTTGTTLWQAIQGAGLSSSVQLNFVGTNTAGSYTGDVGIVAVGETPYAEGVGDSSTLALSSSDAQQVNDVCSRVTKCVMVLFSGRPIMINTQVNQANVTAIVAAWLPGTEGAGMTDVIFGSFPFTGKLTYTWPSSVSQEPINNGDGKTGQFAYGFGLTAATGTSTPTTTSTTTNTVTNTPTRTNTATFTPTSTQPTFQPPTNTFTPTAVTSTATRTNSPTSTRTNTATRTPSRTNTPTKTATGGASSTPSRTNTATNTPTRTLTATSTSTGSAGTLKVQLQNGGTDSTQQSQFNFKVVNTGAAAQSNISVRVYLQLDGSQAISKYVIEKYWDQSGIATVSGPTLASGSIYYYTISFGTTSLAAGGSWQYNAGLHLSDWSNNFSAGNDFWHTGYAVGSLPAAFTDTGNIPAYLGSSLVWGSIP